MKTNQETRLSSYQKLKKQNQELKNDIAILVEKGDTLEGMEIKARWGMRLQIERMIMLGMRFDPADLDNPKTRSRNYERGDQWLSKPEEK